MTETYKIIKGLSPPIMENFFILQENTHNVRNFKEICTSNRMVSSAINDKFDEW